MHLEPPWRATLNRKAHVTGAKAKAGCLLINAEASLRLCIGARQVATVRALLRLGAGTHLAGPPRPRGTFLLSQAMSEMASYEDGKHCLPVPTVKRFFLLRRKRSLVL